MGGRKGPTLLRGGKRGGGGGEGKKERINPGEDGVDPMVARGEKEVLCGRSSEGKRGVRKRGRDSLPCFGRGVKKEL